jgi:regulatory protein
LDEKKIEQLQAEDARERALQQALLFLSYRARSESEIRKNLRKHEIPEPVIEETLERLRRDGLANDDQFARAWVENRSTFRPRSRRLMALELRQKGLDEESVSSALTDVDDEALAYEAAQKRASRFASLEWSEFRKKLSGFLARRGFSYSVIAGWSRGSGTKPITRNNISKKRTQHEPNRHHIDRPAFPHCGFDRRVLSTTAIVWTNRQRASRKRQIPS